MKISEVKEEGLGYVLGKIISSDNKGLRSYGYLT
jgi:hypothetical protein